MSSKLIGCIISDENFRYYVSRISCPENEYIYLILFESSENTIFSIFAKILEEKERIIMDTMISLLPIYNASSWMQIYSCFE